MFLIIIGSETHFEILLVTEEFEKKKVLEVNFKN
jgi:stress-induced morphogen